MASGWKAERWPEGWQRPRKEDGGAGDVPQDFTLVLTQRAQGAALHVERHEGRVALTYTLSTFERR